MRSATYQDSLVSYQKLEKAENKTSPDYTAAIVFAAGGGLFFILLGTFALAVFTVFDRNDAELNYAGVGFLIVGFIFFGFAAHFMDKSEDIERQAKRARIAKYK